VHSVAETHHVDAAPIKILMRPGGSGSYPTILYTKPTFLKQAKVKKNFLLISLKYFNWYTVHYSIIEWKSKKTVIVCDLFDNVPMF
jgi:hypothetical protein